MAKYISKKHKEDIYKAISMLNTFTEKLKSATDEIEDFFPVDYNYDDKAKLPKKVEKDIEKAYKNFKAQVDRIAEW